MQTNQQKGFNLRPKQRQQISNIPTNKVVQKSLGRNSLIQPTLSHNNISNQSPDKQRKERTKSWVQVTPVALTERSNIGASKPLQGHQQRSNHQTNKEIQTSNKKIQRGSNNYQGRNFQLISDQHSQNLNIGNAGGAQSQRNLSERNPLKARKAKQQNVLMERKSEVAICTNSANNVNVVEAKNDLNLNKQAQNSLQSLELIKQRSLKKNRVGQNSLQNRIGANQNAQRIDQTQSKEKSAVTTRGHQRNRNLPLGSKLGPGMLSSQDELTDKMRSLDRGLVGKNLILNGGVMPSILSLQEEEDIISPKVSSARESRRAKPKFFQSKVQNKDEITVQNSSSQQVTKIGQAQNPTNSVEVASDNLRGAAIGRRLFRRQEHRNCRNSQERISGPATHEQMNSNMVNNHEGTSMLLQDRITRHSRLNSQDNSQQFFKKLESQRSRERQHLAGLYYPKNSTNSNHDSQITGSHSQAQILHQNPKKIQNSSLENLGCGFTNQDSILALNEQPGLASLNDLQRLSQQPEQNQNTTQSHQQLIATNLNSTNRPSRRQNVGLYASTLSLQAASFEGNLNLKQNGAENVQNNLVSGSDYQSIQNNCHMVINQTGKSLTGGLHQLASRRKINVPQNDNLPVQESNKPLAKESRFASSLQQLTKLHASQNVQNQQQNSTSQVVLSQEFQGSETSLMNRRQSSEENIGRRRIGSGATGVLNKVTYHPHTTNSSRLQNSYQGLQKVSKNQNRQGDQSFEPSINLLSRRSGGVVKPQQDLIVDNDLTPLVQQQSGADSCLYQGINSEPNSIGRKQQNILRLQDKITTVGAGHKRGSKSNQSKLSRAMHMLSREQRKQVFVTGKDCGNVKQYDNEDDYDQIVSDQNSLGLLIKRDSSAGQMLHYNSQMQSKSMPRQSTAIHVLKQQQKNLIQGTKDGKLRRSVLPKNEEVQNMSQNSPLINRNKRKGVQYLNQNTNLSNGKKCSQNDSTDDLNPLEANQNSVHKVKEEQNYQAVLFKQFHQGQQSLIQQSTNQVTQFQAQYHQTGQIGQSKLEHEIGSASSGAFAFDKKSNLLHKGSAALAQQEGLLNLQNDANQLKDWVGQADPTLQRSSIPQQISQKKVHLSAPGSRIQGGRPTAQQLSGNQRMKSVQMSQMPRKSTKFVSNTARTNNVRQQNEGRQGQNADEITPRTFKAHTEAVPSGQSTSHRIVGSKTQHSRHLTYQIRQSTNGARRKEVSGKREDKSLIGGQKYNLPRIQRKNDDLQNRQQTLKTEGTNEKSKGKSYVYSDKGHRRSLGHIGKPLNFLNEITAKDELKFEGISQENMHLFASSVASLQAANSLNSNKKRNQNLGDPQTSCPDYQDHQQHQNQMHLIGDWKSNMSQVPQRHEILCFDDTEERPQILDLPSADQSQITVPLNMRKNERQKAHFRGLSTKVGAERGIFSDNNSWIEITPTRGNRIGGLQTDGAASIDNRYAPNSSEAVEVLQEQIRQRDEAYTTLKHQFDILKKQVQAQRGSAEKLQKSVQKDGEVIHQSLASCHHLTVKPQKVMSEVSQLLEEANPENKTSQGQSGPTNQNSQIRVNQESRLTSDQPRSNSLHQIKSINAQSLPGSQLINVRQKSRIRNSMYTTNLVAGAQSLESKLKQPTRFAKKETESNNIDQSEIIKQLKQKTGKFKKNQEPRINSRLSGKNGRNSVQVSKINFESQSIVQKVTKQTNCGLKAVSKYDNDLKKFETGGDLIGSQRKQVNKSRDRYQKEFKTVQSVEISRRKACSHQRTGSLSKVSIARRQNLNASSKVGSNMVNVSKNLRQMTKSIDQTFQLKKSKNKEIQKERTRKVSQNANASDLKNPKETTNKNKGVDNTYEVLGMQASEMQQTSQVTQNRRYQAHDFGSNEGVCTQKVNSDFAEDIKSEIEIQESREPFSPLVELPEFQPDTDKRMTNGSIMRQTPQMITKAQEVSVPQTRQAINVNLLNRLFGPKEEESCSKSSAKFGNQSNNPVLSPSQSESQNNHCVVLKAANSVDQKSQIQSPTILKHSEAPLQMTNQLHQDSSNFQATGTMFGSKEQKQQNIQTKDSNEAQKDLSSPQEGCQNLEQTKQDDQKAQMSGGRRCETPIHPNQEIDGIKYTEVADPQYISSTVFEEYKNASQIENQSLKIQAQISQNEQNKPNFRGTPIRNHGANSVAAIPASTSMNDTGKQFFTQKHQQVQFQKYLGQGAVTAHGKVAKTSTNQDHVSYEQHQASRQRPFAQSMVVCQQFIQTEQEIQKNKCLGSQESDEMSASEMQTSSIKILKQLQRRKNSLNQQLGSASQIGTTNSVSNLSGIRQARVIASSTNPIALMQQQQIQAKKQKVRAQRAFNRGSVRNGSLIGGGMANENYGYRMSAELPSKPLQTSEILGIQKPDMLLTGSLLHTPLPVRQNLNSQTSQQADCVVSSAENQSHQRQIDIGGSTSSILQNNQQNHQWLQEDWGTNLVQQISSNNAKNSPKTLILSQNPDDKPINSLSPAKFQPLDPIPESLSPSKIDQQERDSSAVNQKETSKVGACANPARDSGLTIMPQGFNEIVAPLEKSQVGMSALGLKQGCIVSPKCAPSQHHLDINKQVSVTQDIFYTSPVVRLQTGGQKTPPEDPAGIAMMESSPLNHRHKPKTGRNSREARNYRQINNFDQLCHQMQQNNDTSLDLQLKRPITGQTQKTNQQRKTLFEDGTELFECPQKSQLSMPESPRSDEPLSLIKLRHEITNSMIDDSILIELNKQSLKHQKVQGHHQQPKNVIDMTDNQRSESKTLDSKGLQQWLNPPQAQQPVIVDQDVTYLRGISVDKKQINQDDELPQEDPIAALQKMEVKIDSNFQQIKDFKGNKVVGIKLKAKGAKGTFKNSENQYNTQQEDVKSNYKNLTYSEYCDKKDASTAYQHNKVTVSKVALKKV